MSCETENVYGKGEEKSKKLKKNLNFVICGQDIFYEPRTENRFLDMEV